MSSKFYFMCILHNFHKNLSLGSVLLISQPVINIFCDTGSFLEIKFSKHYVHSDYTSVGKQKCATS